MKFVDSLIDKFRLYDSDEEYDDGYEYEDEEEEVIGSSFFKNMASANKVKQEEKPSKPTNNRLVPLKSSKSGSSEVNVIKPDDFNDCQLIANNLCNGKSTILNMEGIEIHEAQRIIDFISGCCYALDGSLQAISNNIFIIAPSSTEISGDFIEGLIGDSYLSPELGKFQI
ncbi:MAG: cell division protein SepF [Lachnospiraceae bacterium]